MIIEITKTPDGPAPEWIRKAWVGVKIRGARRLRAGVPEVDFMKPEGRRPSVGDVPGRGGFVVDVEYALDALQLASQEGTEATRWFLDNLPKGLPSLTFGPDEAVVVEE